MSTDSQRNKGKGASPPRRPTAEVVMSTPIQGSNSREVPVVARHRTTNPGDDEARVRARARPHASTRSKTGRHRRAGLVDGRYELEEMISKGGMGRVFRARHHDLGRMVALKLVLDGFQDDQELRELFFKEARLASSLTHPNIINVTDFGMDDELGYFVVMDLLEGETLRSRLRQKRMPLRTIFEMADQIAGAVRYIHSRDIVHCDLKPENIFLTKVPNDPRRSNEVKLLDFGLSWRRETMPDPKLGGTPPYLAPERLRGKPPSALCDVYSLGILLYELIAGQLPYTGSVSSMIDQQLEGPLPPPPSTFAKETLDERADALVMRAIARNPAHRHASTEAFQFELRAVQSMMGLKEPRRSKGTSGNSQVSVMGPRPSEFSDVGTNTHVIALSGTLALIEDSLIPLALFDKNGAVRLANRTFVERLEGVQVPIAKFAELAITQRHPRLSDMFKRTLEGGAPCKVVVQAGAEGDERPTTLWMTHYRDARGPGVHMTLSLDKA